ncbi:hypothetical protein OG533_01880 [Streptomyces sp. NBC_01186]|uniref:hypothetical protein n=1 Tax=unclassified Streptomyces TaxID=2593676 RepID=UPI002DD97228|nr:MULTISPECIES: hypothetical protein [unclassified Streptomyces]WSB80994.1 hypothetical protein OHB04_38375 [Streptomyces sp. NBC_01775]WSS10795.1 hypothetical protein OG533_01880 [Streptomyces sp. NBC_01186]
MATTVLGFRLGHDDLGRQFTAVVTQSGRLHSNHGVYGAAGATRAPHGPFGENPVHGRVAELRELWAKKQGTGYQRLLIAPVSVRLPLNEPPAPKQFVREAPAPEVIEEFVGAVPATQSSSGLEDAIHDFYTTVGLPARPRNFGDVNHFRAARETALSPRTAACLRALTRKAAITSPARTAVGYRITADTVRLHVGHQGQDLDHKAVVQLQAALTAWLYLNPPGH